MCCKEMGCDVTYNHTRTRTGKSVASEKDSICSSFLGGSVAAPFIDDMRKRTEKKKRENKEIKRERDREM